MSESTQTACGCTIVCAHSGKPWDECDCAACDEGFDQEYSVVYCPLHSRAAELLQLLKTLRAAGLAVRRDLHDASCLYPEHFHTALHSVIERWDEEAFKAANLMARAEARDPSSPRGKSNALRPGSMTAVVVPGTTSESREPTGRAAQDAVTSSEESSHA